MDRVPKTQLTSLLFDLWIHNLLINKVIGSDMTPESVPKRNSMNVSFFLFSECLGEKRDGQNTGSTVIRLLVFTFFYFLQQSNKNVKTE